MMSGEAYGLKIQTVSYSRNCIRVSFWVMPPFGKGARRRFFMKGTRLLVAGAAEAVPPTVRQAQRRWLQHHVGQGRPLLFSLEGKIVLEHGICPPQPAFPYPAASDK